MSKAKATVDRRSTSNVTDNWMQEEQEERHKSTEKTHTLSPEPGFHQESAPLTSMPSGREPACTKTLPTITGLQRQLRATEDTSAATETGSVRPESSTSCSGTYLSTSSTSEDDLSSSSSSSYTEHGPSSPEPRSHRDREFRLYLCVSVLTYPPCVCVTRFFYFPVPFSQSASAVPSVSVRTATHCKGPGQHETGGSAYPTILATHGRVSRGASEERLAVLAPRLTEPVVSNTRKVQASSTPSV